MRSFLRVSGERRKILLDSNVGMNFMPGSAFQLTFRTLRAEIHKNVSNAVVEY
jgi:hypothetical protein